MLGILQVSGGSSLRTRALLGVKILLPRLRLLEMVLSVPLRPICIGLLQYCRAEYGF